MAPAPYPKPLVLPHDSHVQADEAYPAGGGGGEKGAFLLTFCYVPLLVLKGAYHCWNCFSFLPGRVKQAEATLIQQPEAQLLVCSKSGLNLKVVQKITKTKD